MGKGFGSPKYTLSGQRGAVNPSRNHGGKGSQEEAMKIPKIWMLGAMLAALACAPAADQGSPSVKSQTPSVPPALSLDLTGLAPTDTVPGLPSWTRADWDILQRTGAWAYQNKVDTLPIGARIARIGETFVGTPYVPGTLDPPGPERLIINLRQLDCVTFVENMVTLAHFVRETPKEILDRPEQAMQLYQDMITRIRYRDGRLTGYPSRLHYFTDWLRDNERRGSVDLITEDLGGVVDPDPIAFMTSHRVSYKQLVDDAYFAEIGEVEKRLNATPRYFIPEGQVAAVAARIQDGDILAMASTVKGLDVAHTGIAVWKDGGLHLLNAPLVGKDVEISEKVLADRLAGIGSQDGVMVGRPLEKPLLDP